MAITDKLSIIPADGKIVKNGKPQKVIFQNIDSKIHAIQWNGKSGIIEMKQGATQFFDNYELITELVGLYDKAEADGIAAQLAADAAAAKLAADKAAADKIMADKIAADAAAAKALIDKIAADKAAADAAAAAAVTP